MTENNIKQTSYKDLLGVNADNVVDLGEAETVEDTEQKTLSEEEIQELIQKLKEFQMQHEPTIRMIDFGTYMINYKHTHQKKYAKLRKQR